MQTPALKSQERISEIHITISSVNARSLALHMRLDTCPDHEYRNETEHSEANERCARPKQNMTHAAKQVALNIVGETLKDTAKEHVKQTATQMMEVCKAVVPMVVKFVYLLLRSLSGT